MGFSRAARIKTLLVIDTAFFFLEIIVGYAVGSLALVADSYHMLNDVASLIVALYALKLAEDGTRSNKYSYGWQRAEILGALVNGVFLLALCFSIFLEAVQRLVSVPDVDSPKLIVIVGSLGLLSNIVGLFLFHEHGHSHGGGGGHGHDHGHSHGGKVSDDAGAAEEGHANSHAAAVSSGRKRQGSTSNKKGRAHSHGSSSHHNANERSPLLSPGRSGKGKNGGQSAPITMNGSETPFSETDDGSDDGGAGESGDSINDLLVHPARTREAIVRQAYDAGFGTPRASAGDGFSGHRRTLSTQSQSRRSGTAARRDSGDANRNRVTSPGHAHSHQHAEEDGHAHEHDHGHGGEEGHEHTHDEGDHDHDHEESHGHGGHSHGNMNMRGVFLHVLGDALGNVGVIAAGLIIWLTRSPWRFYSDPAISLIITCIIFSSALPLVRSASFILLQGTPSHVPLEKVRSAILRIRDVVSVHDLHIWSLSESKLVASMHILVKSQDEFARVSNEVRTLLHRFGVHSSTIQPELLDGSKAGSILSRQGSRERLILPNGNVEEDDAGTCTVQCVDDSCVDSACCPPGVTALASKSNSSLRPSSATAPGSTDHSSHTH